MSDLIDQVRTSFETPKGVEKGSPVTVMSASDVVETPGFHAMKSYFETRILIINRRGYRYFAGATLTDDADALLTQTAQVMLTPTLATMFRAFSDGVLVGHQTNHLVRQRIYFEQADELWGEDEFLAASKELGSGFADDDAVCNWFAEYLRGGINHLAHVTGFAHTQVEPTKVWDIWVMGGMASVCACYLAGTKLGTTWRERDVLDGIEIATEEGPVGPTGEDRSDH
jgi:hypothetical protein